jgi:prepilin peptidase CpaA
LDQGFGFGEEQRVHTVAWWPVLAVVLVATATDLRSRRIPNWLVLPFLVAGIGVNCWQHGWQGAAHSLEGLGLGLLLFGILFFFGGMGAGDVKLAAAIGAWIGPQQLLLALVLTAIAGGLMAVGWAVAGGFLGELLDSAAAIGARPGSALAENAPRKRRPMPYAPAIAIGTVISFFAC